MDFFVTVISLGIVVLVHEFGHYIVARLSGVRVFEFSVGMGPILFSKYKNDTLYSLRAFPVGGFVKLAGMDDSESVSYDASESYKQKSFLAKISIIAAGPVMNFILTYLLFVIIFFFVGKGVLTPVIESVIPDSPAYHAGLEKGDEVLRVDGHRVTNVENDVIYVISHSSSPDEIHELEISRDGDIKTFFISPNMMSDQNIPRIGIQLGQTMLPVTGVEAVVLGKDYFVHSFVLVLTSIKALFSDQFSLKNLSGPIGIIQVASYAFESGVIPFLNLIAFISLMLGIMNLIPFPVFDGGHIFFLCLEKIRGKALEKKSEIIINNICIAFLLTLMFVVIVNDVVLWKERVAQLKGLLSYDQN